MYEINSGASSSSLKRNVGELDGDVVGEDEGLTEGDTVGCDDDDSFVSEWHV